MPDRCDAAAQPAEPDGLPGGLLRRLFDEDCLPSQHVYCWHCKIFRLGFSADLTLVFNLLLCLSAGIRPRHLEVGVKPSLVLIASLPILPHPVGRHPCHHDRICVLQPPPDLKHCNTRSVAPPALPP